MDEKEIKKQEEQDKIQEDLKYYVNELKSNSMFIYFCLFLLTIILSLLAYFSDRGVVHQAPGGEPEIVVLANLDNSSFLENKDSLENSAYLKNKDSLIKGPYSNVLSLQKEVKSLEKVDA